MVIGFTGTQRGMTILQTAMIDTLLDKARLVGPIRAAMTNDDINVTHGDCRGADDEFDAIAVKHHLHRNLRPCNIEEKRAHCEEKRPSSHSLYNPRPPLVRNRDIVHESHFLIVAPSDLHEILRSGTWATYRYAKKLGKPRVIVYPNGTMKWES